MQRKARTDTDMSAMTAPTGRLVAIADTRQSERPAGAPATAALELTILMPCLNEAETISTCVAKARSFLARAGIAGEVLVADNGSSDGSAVLAQRGGARVIAVAERGYGAALRACIVAAIAFALSCMATATFFHSASWPGVICSWS